MNKQKVYIADLRKWCGLVREKHGEQCYKNGCPFAEPLPDVGKCICDKYRMVDVPKLPWLEPWVKKLETYANGGRVNG